ncbi:hypothetical protein ACWHLZ_32900 [Streptomyces chartreusis]
MIRATIAKWSVNSGRGRTQSMASDTRSASRPHETLTRLGVPSSWYTWRC